jgi:hypothetical protein
LEIEISSENVDYCFQLRNKTSSSLQKTYLLESYGTGKKHQVNFMMKAIEAGDYDLYFTSTSSILPVAAHFIVLNTSDYTPFIKQIQEEMIRRVPSLTAFFMDPDQELDNISNFFLMVASHEYPTESKVLRRNRNPSFSTFWRLKFMKKKEEIWKEVENYLHLFKATAKYWLRG